MSAVIDHPQASLAGVDAVPAPELGEQLVNVALYGPLLHRAVVRTASDHTVRLEVLFRQQIEHHPRALPVLAVWTYPDLGSFALTHDHVRAKVHAMQEGAEVMALGRGLELARHEGLDVLRLIHVDGIDLTSNHKH